MESLRALSIQFRDTIWRPQWKFLLVVFLLCVGFSILPIYKTERTGMGPKDYHTWQGVAQAVREGTPIYPPDKQGGNYGFFYPPAIATLFYAPLSLGGPVLLVALLCALSFLGYITGIYLSVLLATGHAAGQPKVLYILPWLISIPFAWDTFSLGQLNMTLLPIMLLGFMALDRKRFVTAGVLFALPAAAKAFPVTVIVYLIWRKYFVAAASMVLALFLILVIFPAPFRGFDRNLQELNTWSDQTLMHNSGDVLVNQRERAYHYGNQTLLSVVHRLTRDLNVGSVADRDLRVNFINVSAATAFKIFFVLAGGIGIAFLWAMPPKNLQTPETRALEYSIMLILMVVLSPKAGPWYYCWMIPGFTVVFAEALRVPRHDPKWRWIVGGASASIFVLATALAQAFTRWTQAVGATVWGSLILFVVLVALLRFRKRQILLSTGPRTP